MKFHACLAAALLAVSAGSASANDLQVDAGHIPLATPYTHVFAHDAGSFTDTVDFVVPVSGLGTSANPLSLTLDGQNVLSIAGLSYELWGGTSATNQVSYGTFIGNDASYALNLAAGQYHLSITGATLEQRAGAYGLALISGVPEPESYAMMGFGLGLVAWVARRRKERQRA